MSIQNFIWPPDWSGKFTITYSLQTVISQNERLVEQRASMRDIPLRTLEFSNVEVENASLLSNILLQSLQQPIYVPIFSEPLFVNMVGLIPASPKTALKNEGQGVNTWMVAPQKALAINLAAENDATLGNITYATGIYYVDSLPNNKYNADSTVIFPAIQCYLDEGFKKMSDTVAVHNFDLRFREVV
jgi:hypothetical protein